MQQDVQTIIIILGGIANLLAIGAGIYKLGGAITKFEQIGLQQKDEISQLKDAIKIVGDLMTKMALQTQRQDTFSERLNRIERLLEDLRRGEGMILPHNKV